MKAIASLLLFALALVGCSPPPKLQVPPQISDFKELDGLTLTAAVGMLGNPSRDDVIAPAFYRTDKGPPGGLARRYMAAGGTNTVRALQWKEAGSYTAAWFVQTNDEWYGCGGYKVHGIVRW